MMVKDEGDGDDDDDDDRLKRVHCGLPLGEQDVCDLKESYDLHRTTKCSHP